MPWDNVWNSVLDWLSQVVTPNWNDVIGWLPSLTFLLLVVVFLALVGRWWAQGGRNASRVPAKRRPATPAGLHMPGPSFWPFLVPVGLVVMFFGLVVHPGRIPPPSLDSAGNPTVGSPVPLGQVFDLPLIALGLLITVVAAVGWYRDAGREWRRTDNPELAVVPAAPARPPQEPPPGVHLPGPSPWPFFVPVSLAVIFFGLIFSPALAVGGVLMVVIAAIGWYRDANHELSQVEAGHPPEPRTRDPERAFPTALVGVYAAIGVIALALTFAPQMIAIANYKPTPSPSPSAAGGTATSAVKLVAKDIKFDLSTITVAADTPFTITFTNDDTVPHNVAIFEGSDATGKNVFRGELNKGSGATVVYDVPALPAGTYYFHCDVHPNMNGTLISK
jgi:plastocyanin